jgi:regulator of sigma E protease
VQEAERFAAKYAADIDLHDPDEEEDHCDEKMASVDLLSLMEPPPALPAPETALRRVFAKEGHVLQRVIRGAMGRVARTALESYLNPPAKEAEQQTPVGGSIFDDAVAVSSTGGGSESLPGDIWDARPEGLLWEGKIAGIGTAALSGSMGGMLASGARTIFPPAKATGELVDDVVEDLTPPSLQAEKRNIKALDFPDAGGAFKSRYCAFLFSNAFACISRIPSSLSLVLCPVCAYVASATCIVFMILLVAWLLFSVGFMSGLPTGVGSEPSGTSLKDVHTVIVAVAPKSPAEKAGLKNGDKIMEISLPYSSNSADYIENPSPEQIQNLITHQGGSTPQFVGIKYNRANTENYVIVSPEVTDGKARVGISMDQIGVAKLGFWSSLSEGARLTWYVTKSTALGLYGLLKDALLGKGSLESVTGPVGMVGIVGDAYKFGFVYLMSFAALISINLGIINLLPFPALDGGRILFVAIESIVRRQIHAKFQNIVNAFGFVLLMILMVIVSIKDIIKLFK